MARTAHLPIVADRYEACVRTIIFRGLDLRGVPLRSQVRLLPDTPGAPLADLQSTMNGNAEGLRVVDFTIDAGVSVTTIEFVVNESTVEAMPYQGEVGAPAVLAYDLQATIAGRKRRLLAGPFVILAGVTGADAAPSDRPQGCSTGSGWSQWSTATVDVTDRGSEVRLAGLDLIDATLASLLDARAAKRDRMEARALLYGVADLPTARLWAAEATEIAFADGVYRDGYVAADSFTQMPDVDTAGPLPIDGRGLLVTGDTAAGVVRPAIGDVTFIFDAEVPANDGILRVIGSFVGDLLENRVAVYRSDTGIYALQVSNGVQGFQFVGDLADPTARRIRVAVSIGAKLTRASFAGRPPVRIVADRPANLLRLWAGRLAKGQGDPLNGRVIRAAVYPHAVTDQQLQTMSGGPVTDDEISQLIDQKIETHDNGQESHDLAALRGQIEIMQARTGFITIKAADDFAGPDGPLTTAPTGGQAWVAVAGNPIHRISGAARTPDGTLRGTYLQTGVTAGQVEADLAPGTNEASLYIRFQSAANYLLLQRKPEGFVGLYRFVNGAGKIISPSSIYRPVVAGERFKVLMQGPRLWAFRVVGGVEELLFDVTETSFQTVGNHGIRLAGTGSADNFRILQRESI